MRRDTTREATAPEVQAQRDENGRLNQALPKIVRLRNQRVDRGSGHQVVELEEGGIEAIQLGRVEG